ncbi:MAG: efflux transporter outer membrane subunit [Caulobacteraceae bacterium]
MRRSAALLALAAPLWGCASAPHRAPDLRLPARYEAPAGGAALAPAALDRWWLLFDDPRLDALEDEAARYSPDARTAAARVLEAKATRDSQTAQTLPTGDIAGNVSRQRSYNLGGKSDQLFPIGGTTDTESLNFDVSWELDLFGRLATARRVAGADLAQARFNIEGTRASLAASVADNYFQANGLAIQLADARQNVRIESDLQSIAQKKAAAGLGAATDADRVAGDLSQAKAQAEDLAAQLHIAERQLLILVGRGVDPVESLPVEAAAPDAPRPPAAIPGDLLARRPDVREAEAHLRSQAGTAHLRHLAIFPTFTLLPGLGLSSVTSPGVSFIPPSTLVPAQQTTTLGFWTLGAGVTVPVLDIPKLLYDARAEDARTEQAVIAYEKTVQTAYGEAENALVNLGAGERAVAVLTDGEARAHRASQGAAKLYAMGLGDLTTALTAEQAWRTTRAALTAERVAALRRAVQAYKALGGGWAYTASTAKPR